MTSKQKRLNIELHRKVSILTEKTKDFLKASQAAVVEEVQCEIAGHVQTPTAKAARTLSSPTQPTGTGSSPGIMQRPQASPCEVKGKRSGAEKGRAGGRGAQSKSPSSDQGGRDFPLHRQFRFLCCGWVWLFSPAFLSFIL